MIDAQQLLMLACTLKGAALSCLFVLSALKQPLSIKDLAGFTGYDRKSVSVGLDRLRVIGLAAPNPDGLWELTCLDSRCSEIPNTSSSSFKPYIESLNDSLKPLLPTAVGRISEHVDHRTGAYPLDISHLVDQLTQARCAKKKATEAIETALHNHSLETIEADIQAWLDYCRSEAGQGIKNAGIFTAAKLRNGERPPDPKPEQQSKAWYTEEELDQLIEK